jgi:hypothetical protein
MNEAPSQDARASTGPTMRTFFIGAGFSKPAGLPVAGELLPLVLEVAARHFHADGGSFLERAVESYRAYLADVYPDRSFDLEEFGAWLDWEHILRLRGSDTFGTHGNEAGLQYRWAIGKVLYDLTPATVPDVYLDFASKLTVSDRILTLNYDLLIERSLEAVGLPYRRFPFRLSEVYEDTADVDIDHPRELVLSKLHGSLDWTYRDDSDTRNPIVTNPLTEGPRFSSDPLLNVEVIDATHLAAYYADSRNWLRHPSILMPPSTAKPLASSELVPLWDGVGNFSYMLGGFTVIGCSLPPGDPYVLQLVHHIATDYVAGREKGGNAWPQRRMTVVDLRSTPGEADELRTRFRFMDQLHTDFVLDGFTQRSLEQIFAEPDLYPDERQS